MVAEPTSAQQRCPNQIIEGVLGDLEQKGSEFTVVPLYKNERKMITKKWLMRSPGLTPRGATESARAHQSRKRGQGGGPSDRQVQRNCCYSITPGVIVNPTINS